MRGAKRILTLVLLFISIYSASSFALFISEIMYNPEGNDNNLEYIELYSDVPINLSDYTIEDIMSSDKLELLYTSDSQYFLIVEEGFNYSSINASVYSAGSTIGNNLNNDYDIVIIRDNNGLIADFVYYSSEQGGDGNGKSIERVSYEESSFSNENWKESAYGGTPGRANSIASQTGCDWNISLIINNSITYNPEWKLRVQRINGDGKTNLTVIQWIENSDGETIKEYSPVKFEDASTQRTSGEYKPVLAEGEGYLINAEIKDISCEDQDISNNKLSQLIFIKGQQSGKSEESSILLEKFSPEKPEFGEAVKVTVHIYRGETQKYAVKAYIEGSNKKISEESTFHAKDKFANYTLTIPIQLKPNCDGKYEDGEYRLVIEGLDESESQDIEVEGISSFCDAKTVLLAGDGAKSADSNKGTTKGLKHDLISEPGAVYPGKRFNATILFSGDDKEHDFAVWGYVYRGSKSYSGSREENMEKFKLLPFEEKKIILPINVENSTKQGDYKLKIKIKKDSQKTDNEITKELVVEDLSLAEDSESTEKYENNGLDGYEFDLYNKGRQRGIVVYESSSMKAKELAPIILSGALVLILTAVALKRAG